MSRIKYQLYGRESAISALSFDEKEVLYLTFPRSVEGFIRIGARIYKLADGVATVDLSPLDKGEHRPILFTAEGETRLSGFVKEDSGISLIPRSAEECALLWYNVKELEKRLNILERRADGMQSRIYNTKIF